MWRRVFRLSAAAVCLAGLAILRGSPPQPPAELERLNTLIEELTQLKSEVASLEARIDALLRGLSEQRGALQNKPGYDALKAVAPARADEADRKPPLVRCAAITASGTRCTRAAAPGSRYCRQHQLAHQK